MKTVSRIDPIPRKQKKLRVAAYCRVSTDMDAQLESLEAQKSYYENYIGSRADWVLVGRLRSWKNRLRPDKIRQSVFPEHCGLFGAGAQADGTAHPHLF